MALKYRVLFWHTCGHTPKPFMDMLFTEMVDEDGKMKQYTFIDFNEHPFPEVIKALKGLNLMILNDVNAIWIDSRRFRQS